MSDSPLIEATRQLNKWCKVLRTGTHAEHHKDIEEVRTLVSYFQGECNGCIAMNEWHAERFAETKRLLGS